MFLKILSFAFAITFAFVNAGGQTKSSAVKLPSAEKIVERYLKAIGGKKRVSAVTDATYEWIVQVGDRKIGTARSQLKSPSSLRYEITLEDNQTISTTSSSSAWRIGVDGQFRTLTGPEASVAKLQGILDASHLVDYKKSAVLARSVSLDQSGSEPAYIVEFSSRSGARLRYSFSGKSNLLIKITDDVANRVIRFGEYRDVQGVLQPHRIELKTNAAGELTLLLQRATYNTGLANSLFDPPASADTLDVTALLRDVSRNQDEVEKRVTEYAFTQKETDREITSKGELKKETVKVYEVFPVANREPVQKLISENGVPLSPERAAKEEKRVQEEFLKVERDRDKDAQKEERRKIERDKKRAEKAAKEGDDDPEISLFLKVCEFVSPRREKFGNRDAIVFDFRPRQGFRPGNREETLIAKLVGAVWIDPIDKQVMRLEARLAEGFKMAGGLLLSLRPGAAFVMEQTRMIEGVWLPRYAQVNLSVKVLLFGGGDFNKTIEWSDYRHFSGDVSDYKIDAPKPIENKKPE